MTGKRKTVQPTLKSLEKDIRAKHSIGSKYESGKLLDEDTLVKALAEADQKVRKKKQLTKAMIINALEYGTPVRFLGSIRIQSEGDDKRLVKVMWKEGRLEAVFSCWKENGVWFGKRVDLETW